MSRFYSILKAVGIEIILLISVGFIVLVVLISTGNLKFPQNKVVHQSAPAKVVSKGNLNLASEIEGYSLSTYNKEPLLRHIRSLGVFDNALQTEISNVYVVITPIDILQPEYTSKVDDVEVKLSSEILDKNLRVLIYISKNSFSNLYLTTSLLNSSFLHFITNLSRPNLDEITKVNYANDVMKELKDSGGYLVLTSNR